MFGMKRPRKQTTPSPRNLKLSVELAIASRTYGNDGAMILIYPLGVLSQNLATQSQLFYLVYSTRLLLFTWLEHSQNLLKINASKSYSHLTMPRPLLLASPFFPLPSLRPLLLPRVEHITQHIEAKLRILQAQTLKVLLRLMPQHIRAHPPETRNRFPDRDLGSRGIGIHVPRVRQFSCGGSLHAVDFAVRELLELGERELVGEGVDFGVAEEQRAGFRCGL